MPQNNNKQIKKINEISDQDYDALQMENIKFFIKNASPRFIHGLIERLHSKDIIK